MSESPTKKRSGPESSKERLLRLHFDILMVLSSIGEAEKRLSNMKLEAQHLNVAVMDKIENEKQSDV